MAVDFSFGQMEAVCAAMQDISSDKRTAFTSRLKHLMKAGIFDQERRNGRFTPGRGKAAKFSFTQVMQMVVGVELLQAGTPPSLVARLIQGNWSSLRVGIHFALFNEVEKRAAGDPREETYWILAPEALRELSAAGESQYDHYEAFETVYREADLLAHFTQHEVGGVTGHYRRQLVLNGTAITRAAAFLITGELHVANIQELQQAIHAEIDADQKMLDEAIKEMSRGELSDGTTKKLSKMVPVFAAFDERWEQRVLSRIDQLTESQKEVLRTAEDGSEVEIPGEDLLALRKYDLLGLVQGDLVITDLGQEVAAELRRRAGIDTPMSDRFRRQIERGSDVAHRIKETTSEEARRQAQAMVGDLEKRGKDEKPAMIPVELAVLATEPKTFSLEAWWKDMVAAAQAKQLAPMDDSPVTVEQAIAEAGLGEPGGVWHVTGQCDLSIVLPSGYSLLIGGGVDAGDETPDVAIRESAERLAALRARKTDYVVVFVPRDFMDNALALDRTLVDWAFERRVLLVTPGTLRHLLGTIADVWDRAEGKIRVGATPVERPQPAPLEEEGSKHGDR